MLFHVHDTICVQPEFGDNRQAHKGKCHKCVNFFRDPGFLEGSFQCLQLFLNLFGALHTHQTSDRQGKLSDNSAIQHKGKTALIFTNCVACQYHVGVIRSCHNEVVGIMCDA